MKPFLVVDVIPAMGDVTQVLRPLPQNAWGGRSSDRTAEILASQRLDAVRRRKRCKRDRKEPHENCHHRHHFGADSLDRAVLNRFLQVPEPVPPTLKPVAFERDLCRTYNGASLDIDPSELAQVWQASCYNEVGGRARGLIASTRFGRPASPLAH